MCMIVSFLPSYIYIYTREQTYVHTHIHKMLNQFNETNAYEKTQHRLNHISLVVSMT